MVAESSRMKQEEIPQIQEERSVMKEWEGFIDTYISKKQSNHQISLPLMARSSSQVKYSHDSLSKNKRASINVSQIVLPYTNDESNELKDKKNNFKAYSSIVSTNKLDVKY